MTQNTALSYADALGSTPIQAQPTIDDIARAVAARHHLTLWQLCGVARAQRYSMPRDEAFWLAYQTGRYSSTQIGRYFGNRDHTTVLYGIRRHAARLDARAAAEAGREAA